MRTNNVIAAGFDCLPDKVLLRGDVRLTAARFVSAANRLPALIKLLHQDNDFPNHLRVALYVGLRKAAIHKAIEFSKICGYFTACLGIKDGVELVDNILSPDDIPAFCLVVLRLELFDCQVHKLDCTFVEQDDESAFALSAD